MGYSYSASLNTFFHTSVPDRNVPSDAVDITDEQHEELMLRQARGMRIQAGEGGLPEAVVREAGSAVVATTQ